jgi:RNA polymerase sigma-70 factor (ECF subfamily)
MDDPPHGTDLERYRDYLLMAARQQLDARFQGKVDLSGVVQQTLLEAHQALAQLPTGGEQLTAAWLRRILANNLRDEVRKLTTAARDVERSLEPSSEQSSARLEGLLAADQSSPSERAVRQEELLRLAEALTRLPEDQRRAVKLHHLQGLSLAATAEALGRGKGAVAALLFRGLKRLRELLTADSSLADPGHPEDG